MAKWRYFADRELPRVIRELGIPCAEPVHATGMTRCPRHGEPLGTTSRICLACHDEAWAEIGRRYRAQGRPVTPDPPDDERLARPARYRNPTPKEESMNTTNDEPLEGELVPAVIDYGAPAATLFGTDDPATVIARATGISNELARVIRDKRLYAGIGGREHVLVEGWTLLGSMLGLFPYTVWTRKLEDGWEARVEARTVDGRAIAAAEAECLRAERKWAKADDYAVRSMAQTRATSKALRLPLGFVMQLAGFDATPAEEIPASDTSPTTGAPITGSKIPEEAAPTGEQKQQLRTLFARLAELAPDVDWPAKARELAGVPGNMLTRTIATRLIEELAALEHELAGEETSAR